MKKFLLVLLAIIVAVGLYFKFSPDARKSLEIAAVDKIGDIAVSRMNSANGEGNSVAADFINIPIEAREISDGVYQATGVGNVHLITTPDGNVMFDTGLVLQTPKQMEALEEAAQGRPLTHIIVSHSHADHSGGVSLWREQRTEIIAHAEFEEEQRYLTELEDYFWHRNRTLFPFMPESPQRTGPLAYGGVEPDRIVHNHEPYSFSQGGVDFEVIAAPGAEGADNLLLWLPQKKILFSGDFFGPLFPQFPNVFTMRGEKIRKPIEYIRSLEMVIALKPEIIVPSHLDPVADPDVIMAGLTRMRDAVQFVHDETVKGMNEGKTVHQLMAEIQLPQELALSQEHGRVSWAVKSIWEYYATWFHFDKTTELYPVPASDVYGDILDAAGADALIAKARAHIDAARPLHSLHLVDIVLGVEEMNMAALEIRKAALEALLQQAKDTYGNSYEIYWLNYRLRDTNAKLQPANDGQ